jgi:hypothetical protein
MPSQIWAGDGLLSDQAKWARLTTTLGQGGEAAALANVGGLLFPLTLLSRVRGLLSGFEVGVGFPAGRPVLIALWSAVSEDMMVLKASAVS